MEMKAMMDLEIVWKDESMLEVQVLASNDRYAGTTEVYTTRGALIDFAESLRGFPRTTQQQQLLEMARTESGKALLVGRLATG